MMKKLLKTLILLMVFALSLAAFACNKTKVKITIAPENGQTSVYTGQTLQLNATVMPEEAGSVVWSVSGLSDCSISDSGLLTVGNTVGTVTVNAEVSGKNASATCEITILERLTPSVVGTPNDVSVTYGDALSGDMITGTTVKYQDTVLTGSYQFNNTEVLAVGTHNVEVTFTPDDDSYKTVDFSVSVTVAKMELTVKATNRSISWGDTEPSLTYSVISGKLVGKDKPTGSLAREAGTDVGEYAISQGTLDFGGNYNVTFIGGTFTVTKATAEITFENLTVDYNGQKQSPVIKVTPTVDYKLTISDEEVDGKTDAGRYEVKVEIDPENANISGSATEVFVINKLNLAISATETVQEYNAAGNAIKLTVTPAVDDLIITYKNDNYNNTVAPSEAGVYTVTVTQPAENYVLDNTEFTYTLNPNGKFSDEVKLYVRNLAAELVYNEIDLDGAISKIMVAGAVVEAEKYTLSGNTLTFNNDLFANSTGTDLRINVYTDTKLLVADVYVIDYAITADNWKDFLTNTGANTLIANTERLSKSYILMTDITYGEEDYFLGIGKSSVSGAANFTGLFDGNGHTITNWTARVKTATGFTDELTKANSGFIATNMGTIRNTGFVNITVKVHGATVGHYFGGGIAGAMAGGKIINCFVNGVTVHSYCAAGSEATADNSGVGVIFAVTGNAAKENPSLVENVIVYGEITLVGRQGKNIRGIGQASASQGRFITVNNVYVSSEIEAYEYGSETPLENAPVLIDSRNQVVANNTQYKAPADLKVGADAEIYADFDKNVWNFTAEANPVLKVIYN